MSARRTKRPSRAGRREQAARRRARAFYRLQNAGCGADVLPKGEAESLAPWRGSRAVLAAFAATAVLGWIMALVGWTLDRMFS